MSQKTALTPHYSQMFTQRCEKLTANAQRCSIVADEDAIHDLRVSIRRLLAFLDLAEAHVTIRKMARARKRLKQNLKRLNPLRDAQVMAQTLARSGELFGEEDPFRGMILAEREHLFSATAEQLQQHNKPLIREKARRRVVAALEEMELQEVAPDHFSPADVAFGACLRRYAQLDAAKPASVHRLRIAFKRFRYTIEVLSPLLPMPVGVKSDKAMQKFNQQYFQHLHTYQQLMGDLQDAEVLRARYAHFIRKNPEHCRQEQLNGLEQNVQVKIQTFFEQADMITRFWRSNPAAEFPWRAADETDLQIPSHPHEVP